MHAIDVENVSFAYTGGANILENLNFSVENGEILVLAGLSGCGKTTLCRILCGIIPKAVNGELHGQIKVLGERLSEIGLPKAAAKVGLVFQNPDNQIVCTTVEDELAFGPENLCWDPSEIRCKVDAQLKFWNLEELRLMNPAELSGGQKKLVTIAGMLIFEPEIVILDEPMTGLDSDSRELVRRAIFSLKEQGKTIVIVEHDLKLVDYADRWLILQNGKIAAIDQPQTLLSDQNMLREMELWYD